MNVLVLAFKVNRSFEKLLNSALKSDGAHARRRLTQR